MQFYSIKGEFKRGCPCDEWTRHIVEGLKKVGMEPEPGPKLEGWMKDAGFINIHQKILPIPVGVWPKDKRLVNTHLSSEKIVVVVFFFLTLDY